MSFNSRLKQARKQAGFTQSSISTLLGIAKSTYCGYETGSSEPSIHVIVELIRLLNITPEYLFQDEMNEPSGNNLIEYSTNSIMKYSESQSHLPDLKELNPIIETSYTFTESPTILDEERRFKDYTLGKIRKSICKNIRELAVLRKTPQVDIAKHIGVSQGTVSNWFNGTNSIDIENLVKLCRYFGVTLDQICGSITATPEVALSNNMQKKRIEQELKDFILCKYGSLREFSVALDMPYSTIDSIFKRGIENTCTANIIKICRELRISLDSLADGEIVIRTNSSTSNNEDSLLNLYRKMNDNGQKILLDNANAFAGNPIMLKAPPIKE